jgi:hypothetical protein
MLSGGIFAQRPEKFACSGADAIAVEQYFDDHEENQKLLTDFLHSVNDSKPQLPFCWSGCVVRLVKPYYPDLAQQYRIFGTIRVETIADGAGKIVYAKATDGPSLLRRAAQQAACHSSLTPILLSGKPINFRWNIVYNFIP